MAVALRSTSALDLKNQKKIPLVNAVLTEKDIEKKDIDKKVRSVILKFFLLFFVRTGLLCLVAGMESMALFAEISGVQPKFPSVQVCNTTKCAPQVCNVVDMVCTHLANQNRGKGFRENFALFLPRFQAITCVSV